MSTMSALAYSGRTIISTIHQPRSSIFALVGATPLTSTVVDVTFYGAYM